jgi:hypothetical protein
MTTSLEQRAAQLLALGSDGVADDLEEEFPEVAPSVVLETIDKQRREKWKS